jgi:hypothetical protein
MFSVVLVCRIDYCSKSVSGKNSSAFRVRGLWAEVQAGDTGDPHERRGEEIEIEREVPTSE